MTGPGKLQVPLGPRSSRPVVAAPAALLVLVAALPVLVTVWYLFRVGGSIVLWTLGLREGAPVDAADIAFAAVLLGGLYALCRFGVVARWFGAGVGSLVALGFLLPLVH